MNARTHQSTETLDHPRLRRGLSPLAFWSVAIGFSLMHIGTNLLSPLYATYAQKYSFGPLTLTAIFACYILTLVPTLMIAGRVSDKVGRRPPILIGLTLCLLASGTIAASHSVAWLFGGRLIQGLGMGVASGAAAAALHELEPQRRLARAATVGTLAFAGGASLGPAIAGGMTQMFGTSPQWIFGAHTVVCLVLLAVCAGTMKRAYVIRAQRLPVHGQARARYREHVLTRDFAIRAAAIFSAWATVGLFLAVVPGVAGETLESDNLLIAAAFPSLLLASSCIAQLLTAAHSSNPWALFVGLILLAVGQVATVLAIELSQIGWLLLGSVVAGFGHGTTFVAAVAQTSSSVPGRARAGVLSALYIPVYLGVGMPVLGVGLLARQTSLGFSTALFSVIIIICATMVAGVEVRRQSTCAKASRVTPA